MSCQSLIAIWHGDTGVQPLWPIKAARPASSRLLGSAQTSSGARRFATRSRCPPPGNLLCTRSQAPAITPITRRPPSPRWCRTMRPSVRWRSPPQPKPTPGPALVRTTSCTTTTFRRPRRPFRPPRRPHRLVRIHQYRPRDTPRKMRWKFSWTKVHIDFLRLSTRTFFIWFAPVWRLYWRVGPPYHHWFSRQCVNYAHSDHSVNFKSLCFIESK